MARAATTARTAKTDSDDPAKDLDAEIAALREDVAAITATLGDVVKYRTGEAKTEAAGSANPLNARAKKRWSRSRTVSRPRRAN